MSKNQSIKDILICFASISFIIIGLMLSIGNTTSQNTFTYYDLSRKEVIGEKISLEDIPFINHTSGNKKYESSRNIKILSPMVTKYKDIEFVLKENDSNIRLVKDKIKLSLDDGLGNSFQVLDIQYGKGDLSDKIVDIIETKTHNSPYKNMEQVNELFMLSKEFTNSVKNKYFLNQYKVPILETHGKQLKDTGEYKVILEVEYHQEFSKEVLESYENYIKNKKSNLDTLMKIKEKIINNINIESEK